MIGQSFPWGEGRRNAILDGGLGPAKWPQRQIWLLTEIVRRDRPAVNPRSRTPDVALGKWHLPLRERRSPHPFPPTLCPSAEHNSLNRN
ncbi:hypothetical protein [Phormidium tenue]|uniref:hypothetical protein n=1 Tax=Phormidium tenue TaxID=126344 RepID=UPI0011151B7A|nr:hypothetical protein [Phormidium tenue]MBD2233388.1 hypothetical protein [Phormidium tenue FACHB-1052]